MMNEDETELKSMSLQLMSPVVTNELIEHKR